MTSTPRRLEQLGELADRVLGLRHGEAVAGHDDDLAGVAEQDRDVLRAARAHRPVARRPDGTRRRALERPEQDRRDRAAHRRSHQPGEDRAARPDERAGHQQQGVRQHVAGRRHGQAGEGVEQRDDDRDVGPAHRQHEQHADGERHQRQQARARRRTGGRRRPARRPRPRSATATARAPPKRYCPPGKVTGRPVMSSCSLAKVMHEPANETQPTSTVNAPAAADTAPPTRVLGELEPGDQGRRRAADAVEQRDELRHLRHRHPARGRDPHDAADHDRGDDGELVVQVLGQERDDDREGGAARRR